MHITRAISKRNDVMAWLETSGTRNWSGCGLALLFSFASFGGERLDALFPTGATVVLLAGLPGDVESENSYAEQVQAWLEIAQASGNVQNLIVLSDNSEGAGLGAAGKLILRADRTNFMSLGATLAGGTNPLVVIAWGHGGKQG